MGQRWQQHTCDQRFLTEVKQGRVPQTLWTYEEVGHTQEAKKELMSLVDFPNSDSVFDTPKPTRLIRQMLRLGTGSEDSLGGGDIVMDFFGGSAATLQAVIEQNAEDGGQRRCIIVQLPEPLDGGGEALKTIADIGRARTRKGIENLKSKADLATASLEDVGFKSFLLTPSNFKQWRGDGIETAEALAEQMKMFVDGENAGAEVEWKLYELLLKFGQELTTPIETLELAGGKVFAIRERQMLFVLKTFSEPMIQALLALKPREVIALDSVFQNSDPLKTNLDLQCRDAGVKFICL